MGQVFSKCWRPWKKRGRQSASTDTPSAPVPLSGHSVHSSGEPTPNLRYVTDPHRGGQRTAVPRSSGQRTPVPRSSRRPTNPRFGLQSAPDPRTSGQSTPYDQRITDPYGGQRFPHPQPTTYPSFSGQPTPNQQRIADPYGGLHIPQAASSGHPGPYSSSQLTVDSRFGTDSWIPPSQQPTPNQQRNTGPYPGGQSVLEPASGRHPPRSSSHSINNGIYTITNVHHKRFVYLEDANDKTPLRGHYNPENLSARWQVKRLVDGEYSIKNVDHGRYANCESRPRLDAFVEGHSEEQIWRIQEHYGGQYTIAAIDNGNFWMLPDREKNTPVTFSKVPTDPMCRWTFESAETTAPMDEIPTAGPALSDPKLLLAPSGGQRTPEAAIVELISVITVASDLIQPLGLACGALRVVLQRAESIIQVNEDWKVLIKRLKFHLDTLENDIAKLEEDQTIDRTIPTLNQNVRESLETYASELDEISKLSFDNQPESSLLMRKVTSFVHNRGIIADRTREIDDAFQRYTAALQQFAANTVAQMQQQLAQFGQEFQQGAHTAAEKAPSNRANAYGIQHRECLPGTREKTLRAISDWVHNENATNWIFFFLDVAGSGKSTVAKHMAEKWKREEQLLARFFFSRDTTATMSTDSFCSTVANAFSLLDPKFKENMEEFSKRPDLGLLPFEERFEGLVARPLRATDRRAILIIDALDECHPKQRDELLQILRTQHSSMPLLRILATGRPERDIKRWANDEFGFGYTNFILLEKSDRDVEIYIKHTLKDLPIVQDSLYPVIHRAEGLFIWARIACDLLLECDDIEVLLEELGTEVSLDYLYKVALQQSMPMEGASRRAMVVVLQMILAAKEPLSIAELEMLSPKPGVVERIVTRLGSVLLYQGREDPIRLLHATFGEFLTTRSKADIFFIQPELGHHTLASGCLTTISNRLQQEDATLRTLDAISLRNEIPFEHDNY